MEVSDSRVVSNSLFIYAGRVINLVFNFFIFVYLANYLGESAFGRFSIAITYVGTFDIIANFGLNQILVRELAGGRTEKSRLLGNGILLKGVITLLALACALAILPFMAYPRETMVVVWIILVNLIVSSKLSSTRTVFESIFQAQLRMAFPILCNILDNLLFVLLIFLAAHFFNAGLTGMALIYGLCNLPGTFWLVGRFLRTNQVSWQPQWPVLRELLRESLPLAFYLFFSILTTKIDVLMLSWMRNEAEVGQYAAATRLVYPLSFLSTSLTISLFLLLSKSFHERREEFDRLCRRGSKYVFLIGLFTSGVLAFAADPIIRTLYVPGYAACIPAFRLLLISLGFSFLNFYFIDILISARRQKLVTGVMALAFAVNLLLNLLLIPALGIAGAGYAKLGSTVTAFLFLFMVLRWQLKISRLLPYARIVLLTAAFLLTLGLMRELNLPLYLLLSVVIFVLFLRAFTIFTYEEREKFTNLITGLLKKRSRRT